MNPHLQPFAATERYREARKAFYALVESVVGYAPACIDRAKLPLLILYCDDIARALEK